MENQRQFVIRLPKFFLTTSGKGIWSSTVMTLIHGKIELHAVRWSGMKPMGELRVFFDRSREVNKHGLVYTDPGWLSGLAEYLTEMLGMSPDAVRTGMSKKTQLAYSEQGMQGDDYVSLDVGALFIAEFVLLDGVKYLVQPKRRRGKK